MIWRHEDSLRIFLYNVWSTISFSSALFSSYMNGDLWNNGLTVVTRVRWHQRKDLHFINCITQNCWRNFSLLIYHYAYSPLLKENCVSGKFKSCFFYFWRSQKLTISNKIEFKSYFCQSHNFENSLFKTVPINWLDLHIHNNLLETSQSAARSLK